MTRSRARRVRSSLMRNHRNLLVWKRAHELAIDVRRLTCGFPKRRYSALQSQMVRAAESILFNIVEGCGCASQKDFARFLDISIKSCTELEAQLELARDYRLMSNERWERLSKEVVEIRRMLCGLRAKVRAAATVQ